MRRFRGRRNTEIEEDSAICFGVFFKLRPQIVWFFFGGGGGGLTLKLVSIFVVTGGAMKGFGRFGDSYQKKRKKASDKSRVQKISQSSISSARG